MKEKVLALAKGNFLYDTPKLLLEPEKLEFDVVSGERRTESFFVKNERGSMMKGFASVEEVELSILSVFCAENNELKFEVNAEELVPGEVLTGFIHVVTDCGESKLPYEIHVISPVLADEKGEIKDYYTLQERMKENPENGAALFQNPNFEKLFLYRDEPGKILYRHLVEKNTKLQGMEEFMVAMGKKEPIRLQLFHEPSGQSKEIVYEVQGQDIADVLTLQVNTWGNAKIKISSTADFIEPQRQVLWTDEFVGNKCPLQFVIRTDFLGSGRQSGKIILETAYEKKEINIVVHNNKGANDRVVNRVRKGTFVALYRGYLAYHAGIIDAVEFGELLRKNQSILEKISDDYRLAIKGYAAVIVQDEAAMLELYRETETMLRPQLDADIRQIENYILIEYTKYLYSQKQEDRIHVRRFLEAYMDNGNQSLLLYWIWLHVEERYSSLRLKAEDIRTLIEQGYNSPLLYSELAKCYCEEPTLIHSLDDITLATIDYGLRNDIATEQIAIVISFLSERVPRFYPVIFSVLERLYEKYELEDTLRSICGLLIRSAKRENKYFKWFAKGVEKHLRMTDLYEYYMYSMDMASTFRLPDSVISYFQFENHLNEQCKAFLYSYIVKKCHEQPDVYENYSGTIWEFALQQLGRRKINEDISVIYEGLFNEENVREEVAKNLPYVMFSHVLTCYSEQMESVVVVHAELKEEVSYSLYNGKAMVQIFSPNVQLFFVDSYGNYYAGTVDYDLKKMSQLDRFAGICYENGSEHMGLKTFLAVQTMRGARIDESQAALIHSVAKSGHLRSYTTGRMLLRLYDYYKEQSETALLLEVLDQINPKRIKRERLGEVAADCIYYGMYDKAEKMLLRYGIYGCDKKALAMLLQERIQEKKGEFSPALVKWAGYLYREHYFEQRALHYLLQYYMGCTDTLTSIYKKCAEIPEIIIDDGSKERLLGQVLFAGISLDSYEKLFTEYYEYGENRVLVKAFLSVYAYEYLVGRMELSENIFVKIEKEAFYEKEDVMVLATLKYYSQENSFAKKQQEFVELNLERYAEDGIILNFMKDFVGKVSVPYEIENAILIQHESGTDKGVYVYVSAGDGTYDVEPMKNVFRGIYTKELLLFAGEEKSCYVYEEETELRTEEKVYSRPAQTSSEPGFFQMVNEMVDAKEQGDAERYEKLRRQHEKIRGVASRLFEIQ